MILILRKDNNTTLWFWRRISNELYLMRRFSLESFIMLPNNPIQIFQKLILQVRSAQRIFYCCFQIDILACRLRHSDGQHRFYVCVLLLHLHLSITSTTYPITENIFFSISKHKAWSTKSFCMSTTTNTFLINSPLNM